MSDILAKQIQAAKLRRAWASNIRIPRRRKQSLSGVSNQSAPKSDMFTRTTRQHHVNGQTIETKVPGIRVLQCFTCGILWDSVGSCGASWFFIFQRSSKIFQASRHQTARAESRRKLLFDVPLLSRIISRGWSVEGNWRWTYRVWSYWRRDMSGPQEMSCNAMQYVMHTQCIGI